MRALRKASQRNGIEKYLATANPRRLNIGCGSNILPGWLNTDTDASPGSVYLDATRMAVIPDGSFDAVFCEHMIEHVSLPDAIRILHEAYRILKPAGMIRIVTPSLTAFCRLMSDEAYGREYIDWFRGFSGNKGADAVDVVNAIFYLHGHRFIWSERRLADELMRAGFRLVHPYPAGSHGSSLFAGADHHGAVIGEAANRFESFAVEARKE